MRRRARRDVKQVHVRGKGFVIQNIWQVSECEIVLNTNEHSEHGRYATSPGSHTLSALSTDAHTLGRVTNWLRLNGTVGSSGIAIKPPFWCLCFYGSTHGAARSQLAGQMGGQCVSTSSILAGGGKRSKPDMEEQSSVERAEA